jgi:hypothetical protein
MKAKKFGFLVIALVLALGTLGIGYASWTDTVYINGTVSTGSACVEWDKVGDYDEHCGPTYLVESGFGDLNLDVAAITGNPDGWPNRCPSYQQYRTEKSVACVEVTGLHTDTLHVTINNGYPLYYVDLELEAIACGTVPMKLQGYTVINANFEPSNYPWDPGPCEDEDWNEGEVWVELSGLAIEKQLEPGGEAEVYSLIIIVQQSAEMNRGYEDVPDPYTFSVVLDWIQWDEFQIPG